MRPTILLVGLGSLGTIVLELLAREPHGARILVGSRHVERTTARCNLARLGARAQGYAPDIVCIPLDLNDEEATANTLRREAPDLVVCAATRQTWWLPDRLPPPQAAVIRRAGFGVWLPVHLVLPLKLMRAWQAAGCGGHVVTAPFPDVVNCVLGRLGLAPTCGVGNLDEIVPKLRLLAAARLRAPEAELRVTLVAHHALESAVFGEPVGDIPPYFLRIEHRDRDVTDEVHGPELLFTPYPVPPGPATHFLTAGSAVRLIRALLADEETRSHAPGPLGLPGGYPILASRRGLRLGSIEGLSLAEAIAINERSHRFDGIERIEGDGTVAFCPESADILRGAFGYDCVHLAPAEAEERADELVRRFAEYSAHHGISPISGD